jgi:amino acid transporter
MQLTWAAAAIVFFALINIRGAELGGRTQIVLTSLKIIGLVALIAGGLLLAAPATKPMAVVDSLAQEQGLIGFLRFAGLGVAIVLFTYDGWIDASNIAGEVKNPNRNFPVAMSIGVILITLIYLLVNFTFLRVVPLDVMRENPTLVAPAVAEAAFGATGGAALSLLMWVSIFGALGGLIMTLPRLFYAAASEYVGLSAGTRLSPFFRTIAYLSPARSVPSGAILFGAGVAIAALFFFGSFSRIVTFFVVPFQFMNILMVSSIFKLRPMKSKPESFRVPGYPVVPAIFIVTMTLFMIAALIYNPVDSLIGITLTLAGAPVYRILAARRKDRSVE